MVTNTELLGALDHRLDAEDETGLVVQLHPVLFHPMLDTRSPLDRIGSEVRVVDGSSCWPGRPDVSLTKAW